MNGSRTGPGQACAGRDGGSERRLQFGQGSQVNVPISLLLWLTIYPMMLKVDFSAIGGIARRPGGLLVTLGANWSVKTTRTMRRWETPVCYAQLSNAFTSFWETDSVPAEPTGL